MKTSYPNVIWSCPCACKSRGSGKFTKHDQTDLKLDLFKLFLDLSAFCQENKRILNLAKEKRREMVS
ncbi:MAG: hypothetical protein CVV01_03560 [Firmicutes bacterium HGW-Firmicutes-6]|nr:MAG: hypothetical protein CVV01_03560 [Firmicutes bacterium HGW-Firmicutes-6]